MTEHTHPTIDEIADLHEGLLPAGRLDDVTAHLRTCSSCQQLAAQLDAVSAVLASEGRDVAMPATVAASIEQTLTQASAERAAGVTSLAERRTTRADAVPRPRRRWTLMAGAAAAVAVIVGASLNGINPGGSDDGASTSAGSADEGQADMPEASAPDTATRTSSDAAGEVPPPPRPVAGRGLAGYAEKLATGRVRSDTDGVSACAPAPSQLSANTVVTTIRWKHKVALLVVDSAAKSAKVLDCATGDRVLYQTGY